MEKVIIDTVSKDAQKKALKRLKTRVIAGEDLCDILKIKEPYYAKKIASGLIDMSVTMYHRIMQD